MHDRLTRSDIEKMEEEIERRKLVDRPALNKAVAEARAHGDLSENFEYHAARAEKRANDSRIAYLEAMVQTAVIIDEKETEENVVAINKPVDVYFPEDHETDHLRLVTTIRGNSLKGLISIDSPIGKAIVGHKEGDTVHVMINEHAGYDLQIKKVYPAVDDTEDEIKSF